MPILSHNLRHKESPDSTNENKGFIAASQSQDRKKTIRAIFVATNRQKAQVEKKIDHKKIIDEPQLKASS